eukprot:CAMPEP_0206529110 /NCGR_PEP_ID=MMETSP0325_2-20121206/2398_1 /ASSEMBLY_ACC=CAM_ASM_000347 /TAXON_ID=2866 /ORGANISM="Crypthecodinium cohnii, Strain Seligo" /LENGTH=252 /DNA_ID=CAMNT_0054024947 /DNA_START=953 /DNA_END=1708 /DNA_ORIENTATION=+
MPDKLLGMSPLSEKRLAPPVTANVLPLPEDPKAQYKSAPPLIDGFCYCCVPNILIHNGLVCARREDLVEESRIMRMLLGRLERQTRVVISEVFVADCRFGMKYTITLEDVLRGRNVVDVNGLLPRFGERRGWARRGARYDRGGGGGGGGGELSPSWVEREREREKGALALFMRQGEEGKWERNAAVIKVVAGRIAWNGCATVWLCEPVGGKVGRRKNNQARTKGGRVGGAEGGGDGGGGGGKTRRPSWPGHL